MEDHLVKATVVIQKPSGDQSEREMTFLVPPRIGETVLVPGLGLTSGFKAVVAEILHQPATRDHEPELYLVLQPEDPY
jgi:hypothetical protein